MQFSINVKESYFKFAELPVPIFIELQGEEIKIGEVVEKMGKEGDLSYCEAICEITNKDIIKHIVQSSVQATYRDSLVISIK